jgi:hypothetical protein
MRMNYVISTPNFTCLGPVLYYFSPSNRKQNVSIQLSFCFAPLQDPVVSLATVSPMSQVHASAMLVITFCRELKITS